jgi:hypothetical protein
MIDYAALINAHPWVIQPERQYIISPDSDGFLCGLLVTNILHGKIAGYYDGKILVMKNEIDYGDCIFLDMEINRRDIPSIGNHLVEYDHNLTVNNRNFNECIQPNNLRGFDGKNSFQQKYPFATIHLLLSILQVAGVITNLPDDAMGPLIFTDGVGNNLFGYPENCLEWIGYLGIDQPTHILNKFLCATTLNFYQIMELLRKFFIIRDGFNAQGFFNGTSYVPGGRNARTGHNLKLSDSQGRPINLVHNGTTHDIHDLEAQRVKGFIGSIAGMMGWIYDDSQWTWRGMVVKVFQKGMLSNKPGSTLRLNNGTYIDLFQKNPFSLAMTASDSLAYTIES